MLGSELAPVRRSAKARPGCAASPHAGCPRYARAVLRLSSRRGGRELSVNRLFELEGDRHTPALNSAYGLNRAWPLKAGVVTETTAGPRVEGDGSTNLVGLPGVRGGRAGRAPDPVKACAR